MFLGAAILAACSQAEVNQDSSPAKQQADTINSVKICGSFHESGEFEFEIELQPELEAVSVTPNYTTPCPTP